MAQHIYPPLEIIVVGTHPALLPTPDFTVPQKATDPYLYAMFWVVEGHEGAAFQVNGQSIPTATGTVLLWRPGQTFSIRAASDKWPLIAFVHFGARVPGKGWPRLRDWPVARQSEGASALHPLFEFCMEATALREPLRTSLLSDTLALMVKMYVSGKHERRFSRSTQYPQALTDSISAIRGALATPSATNRDLTPEVIAARACISKRLLFQLFSRYLETTPGTFVRLCRVERAAALLDKTSLSIKEISQACLFANPFHLSRQFKETLGCTPRAYRALPPRQRPALPPSPVELGQIRTLTTLGTSYSSEDHCQVASFGRSTPERLQELLDTDLKRNAIPYIFPPRKRRSWLPLDLGPLANRGRSGAQAWFGSGLEFPHLPSGHRSFHGIPFAILSDDVAPGKSLLVLRSLHLNQAAFPDRIVLPLGQRIAGLGILHAAGWCVSNEPAHLGDYEMKYADGRSHRMPVVTGGRQWEPGPSPYIPKPGPDMPGPAILQDWWPTFRQFESDIARKVTVADPVQPLTTIRYLYTLWWQNPWPDEPVKDLILCSRPQQPGTLAVLAISALLQS